jgi:hypothetical protein
LKLQLEGIHVDEEKTINDPELLMEVKVLYLPFYACMQPIKTTNSVFI